MFCFYLVGTEDYRWKGSGVPRTVPAAARAGKRYFVKAIAVASPMTKKRSTVVLADEFNRQQRMDDGVDGDGIRGEQGFGLDLR